MVAERALLSVSVQPQQDGGGGLDTQEGGHLLLRLLSEAAALSRHLGETPGEGNFLYFFCLRRQANGSA